MLPQFESTVVPGGLQLLFAFFIGVVPDTALTVIREVLRKTFGKAITSMEEKMPLTNLDGVNLYERARLAEEGIENIENLVHANLIDLMLETRIPLPRLIDWVDQGLLHLHLFEEQEAGGKQASASRLAILRHYGIRNASDLVSVVECVKERDMQLKDEAQTGLNELFGILDVVVPPMSEFKHPQQLRLIYDALQNDEWFSNILSWRDRNRLPGEHIYKLEEMYLSLDKLKAKVTDEERGANSLGAALASQVEPSLTGGTSPQDVLTLSTGDQADA